MAKKSCIGFPTQKAAREAIREIVWKYETHQEFFHPLLQQLFIERPYWRDPPGPRFIRFRWSTKVFPNGYVDGRHFMALSPEFGWCGISFNKAIAGIRMTVERVLTDYARQGMMALTSDYRARNPFCAHCSRPADDVHHTVPVTQIIREAVAPLSEAQRQEIMDIYVFRRGKLVFELPDGHPSLEVILKYHQQPGAFISLCKEHHNTAHGKKTHVTEKLEYDSRRTVHEFGERARSKE